MKMTNTLALINATTNVCENITLDDRNAEDIAIQGFLVLDLDAIGGGNIGDIWDGAKLVPPPTPVNVPASITRRQCALQLRALNFITLQEALDMTKTASVPTAIAAIFAGLPDEPRMLAEIDFAAANYYRNNSLLGTMGLTSEQIDQFFIAAAQI